MTILLLSFSLLYQVCDSGNFLLMTAFQINSDLQAISRIEDSLQQISQVRQKHVEESRSILRGTPFYPDDVDLSSESET